MPRTCSKHLSGRSSHGHIKDDWSLHDYTFGSEKKTGGGQQKVIDTQKFTSEATICTFVGFNFCQKILARMIPQNRRVQIEFWSSLRPNSQPENPEKNNLPIIRPAAKDILG